MKKSTKICLLISVMLLIAGGSMVFYALKSAAFDWNKLTVNAENETYEYTVIGIVRDVKIHTKAADVHVVPSTDGTCRVQAKTASRDDCTSETADGVLTVTCADDSSLPWYKRIWRTDEKRVTVFLPNDAYDRLEIKTGSGDVYVSDALSFSDAVIKTGSGDQECYAPVTDALSVTSDSGEITIKRTGCKMVSAVSGSGTVFLENCRSDSISVTASSGDVTLSACTVKHAAANTASGDICLSQIDVSELLDVSSGSGDILYMRSTAGSMQIKAKSGKVSGELIEPMLFDVRSDSGKIELPPSGGAHHCTIRTGSGDIFFVMQDG